MRHWGIGLVLAVLVGSLIGSGPVATAAPAALPGEGFWRAEGGQLLDARGAPVRITAVTWWGLDTYDFAPHGLWARNYQEMLFQIKRLGYNTVRVPFSNQLFDPASTPRTIDYDRNPDLIGLNGLQILDRLVAHAGVVGLKVLLVRERPDGGDKTPLWYTDFYPESRWIRDWTLLAARYQNNPTVIGAELHNELHRPACWGCGEPAFDWRQAAERAGEAILAVNPNWLIVVQGVDCVGPGGTNDPLQGAECTWWAGNLRGVAAYPVRLSVPNRVVYAVHDNPPSVYPMPWFSTSDFPSNLAPIWEHFWGYLQYNNVAPVLVSSFGSRLESEPDRQWLGALTHYLGTGASGINWAWWCWNPNASHTGGLLGDDWTTVNTEKQNYLEPILYPLAGAIQPPPGPGSRLLLPVSRRGGR